jgi:hypothetical protein
MIADLRIRWHDMWARWHRSIAAGFRTAAGYQDACARGHDIRAGRGWPEPTEMGIED